MADIKCPSCVASEDSEPYNPNVCYCGEKAGIAYEYLAKRAVDIKAFAEISPGDVFRFKADIVPLVSESGKANEYEGIVYFNGDAPNIEYDLE